MKLKFLDSLRTTGSKTAAADRRSFLFKLGVGASATLASTASFAGVAKDKDDAATRLAKLQDEQQLRQLHQAYEKLIDAGRHDKVLELFTDNASVTFNGGVFNKRQGLSRLYRDNFAPNKTGRTMKPAPGFELAADQQQALLQVAPDRLTATAKFPYSLQVGKPLESVTSHVAMARLHGEGVRTWWEGGVYELSYVKNIKEGRWLIDKMEYKTLSRADYREGRTHAEAIEVAGFARVYPEDQGGPDMLV